MKKKIIVAGAGGFGLEIAEYLLEDIASGHLQDCEFSGALDDTQKDGTPFVGSSSVIGDISSYQFDSDEYVVVALGVVADRIKVTQTLEQNGARFYSYVHSSCYVAKSAVLGQGVIVAPNSVVNAEAEVGDFCAINVFSSIGHNSLVGAYSVLSPYSALNGHAKIGERCFLGTRATVFPGVEIGDNCTVDSHSYVKKNAPAAHIISNRGEYSVQLNRLIKQDHR